MQAHSMCGSPSKAEKEIKLTVKQKKTEASLRKAIAAALEEDDEEVLMLL